MAWTPQERKRIEERMKHAGFPVTDEPEPLPEEEPEGDGKPTS